MTSSFQTGHTEVIKSQMVEITRLRTEARQMAASVATVESSKLAMEASSRQLQAVAAATHRGELADLQRSLDAAIIKAKDSEASNAAAAESMPAAIAQARREGEAAAELAAADKAREVASAHSIEMLKLSTEPAELRVQLEQEKSNAERLASKYEAEMAQLNQVVERVSAENAKLHDNMLQTSEQKMALMVEHEERIKLGQQQIELTEVRLNSCARVCACGHDQRNGVQGHEIEIACADRRSHFVSMHPRPFYIL